MTDPAPCPERWLAVPGYEGFYEVSDLGRVRSVRHMTRIGWRGGRVLKANRALRCWQVTLYRDGVATPARLHQLVLLAFTGPCPPGQEGRHGPGGVKDNRLANLCYGTHSENIRDKVRDGTDGSGERNANAKLTQASVAGIRSAAADGESQYVLARRYGVTQANISLIVTGKGWRNPKVN